MSEQKLFLGKLPVAEDTLIKLPVNTGIYGYYSRHISQRPPDSISSTLIPSYDNAKYPISYTVGLLLDELEKLNKQLQLGFILPKEIPEKGIKIEILEPGKRWQSGTLKIQCKVSVEFIPDEPEAMQPPESPLDEIRKQLNIANNEKQT